MCDLMSCFSAGRHVAGRHFEFGHVICQVPSLSSICQVSRNNFSYIHFSHFFMNYKCDISSAALQPIILNAALILEFHFAKLGPA